MDNGCAPQVGEPHGACAASTRFPERKSGKAKGPARSSAGGEPIASHGTANGPL